MASPVPPRSQDFATMPVPIPRGQQAADDAANVPPGSAILSQSESDLDEPDARYRDQEDASVVYGRPQRGHKTRTMSVVRPLSFRASSRCVQSG